MTDPLIRAIQAFEFNQSHNKIYDDLNALVELGFPGDSLVDLIQVFRSTEDYIYFRNGEIVNEIIGIRHSSFVFSIADYLDVPPETGSGFVGRGFAMRAVIDAIRKVLDERTSGRV